MSKPSRLFVLAAALCALATAASSPEHVLPGAAKPGGEQHPQRALRPPAADQPRLPLITGCGKICRPINDPALNADCLSSFDTYEPWRGGE